MLMLRRLPLVCCVDYVCLTCLNVIPRAFGTDLEVNQPTRDSPMYPSHQPLLTVL